MNKPHVILGVDPGTRVTGYGVIQSNHRSWDPLDFGAIRPPQTVKGHDRYLVIFEAIEHLIEKFKPDAIAVETQFVYKNVQSALKLGMARGAVIIAAARNKVEVFEYSPTKAKLAVVGHGYASKELVQQRIQMELKLARPPEPYDAADALALAICHAYYKDKKCSSTFAEN
jgi:crossover junction endodeoxyribonuclease RuvC